MRDTMDILQMAVFGALNGNLSYNSANVPVYDEKKEVGQNDNLYVLLSTQQENDNPQTSDAFITDSSIDIEITHKTGFEVSKKVLNNISNQILEILIPTPSTNGMAVQNLFQIQNVRRTASITRNLSISETQSVLQKIITISAQIVEQNP